MGKQELLQKLISRPGQSQSHRMPPELDIHYADIDERSGQDFLQYASKLAGILNYYRNDPATPAGNWKEFFPSSPEEIQRLLDTKDGSLAPHLALFTTFLRLYKSGPQQVINQFTGRHLAYYFRDILRLEPGPFKPDKAHLLLELKKNTSPILISDKDLFTAGKDLSGNELIYAPTQETIINHAKVESLQSVYFDLAGHGTIRHAPVANSADGKGAELSEDEPRWKAFGDASLPPLEYGFAIASPILAMKEGDRKVTLELKLQSPGTEELTEAALNDAFEAYITGEKSWMGPFTIHASWSGGPALTLDFTVPSSEKAVVAYQQSIHGYRYTASSPVLQVLLRNAEPGLNIGVEELSQIRLEKASLEVAVSGFKGLKTESDLGALDPKKAFAPFGQQPVPGSRFRVGCEEALSKNLSELKLEILWKNPPANFNSHYSGYGISVNNESFTAQLQFTYGENQNYSDHSVPLFDASNAKNLHTLTFTPGKTSPPPYHGGKYLLALQSARTGWSKMLIRDMIATRPVIRLFSAAQISPEPGSITLSLNKSFYHAKYLKTTIEKTINFAVKRPKDETFTALNEPYTPVIQELTLSYKATTGEIALNTSTASDYATDELHFFQLAYGGQMREHAFQRSQVSFLSDPSVRLFAEYPNEGELLIGLSNIAPGDSVSVLFQVADGSENPDLPQEPVNWWILSDNYWKPLGSSEVVLDTTNQLLRSGIIRFVIPTDATDQNTLLAPGFIWLKAGVARNVDAVCELIDIQANAIEVSYTGSDAIHLATSLGPGKITKLVQGNSSVKTIQQPYSSFGGSRVESLDAFNTRVSERLRHKNRGITAWDYERMILQSFPEIHKVKCIQHSRYMEETGNYCWMAPGHLILVVVPDLKNKNAVNPLEPKANSDTISRITRFVDAHQGMQVECKVKNPRYQQVQVECKVKLREGYEFNYYSNEVSRRLVEFLSPWAFDSRKEIGFGGTVYKSVLLNFIEELDYVDYIEDFFLYSISSTTGQSPDVSRVDPETPDTILVSAARHLIHEVK